MEAPPGIRLLQFPPNVVESFNKRRNRWRYLIVADHSAVGSGNPAVIHSAAIYLNEDEPLTEVNELT